MKIIAAKISINGNIFKENYKDLIPLIGKAIIESNGAEINYKKANWTFGEIEVLDDEVFIKGKLFKIIKKENEREWDPKNRKPKKSQTDFVYESSFIFEKKSELIIFTENSNIKREAFKHIFPKLCSLKDLRIGDLKLELCPRVIEIENILKNYEKIFFASFKIIPANFNSDNGFSKLDETMKKENLQQVKIELKNDKGEIDNSEGSFFKNAMKAATRAYGTFKIVVGNNKKKDTYKSEEFIHEKNIDMKNFDDEAKKLINLVEKERID